MLASEAAKYFAALVTIYGDHEINLLEMDGSISTLHQVIFERNYQIDPATELDPRSRGFWVLRRKIWPTLDVG